MSPENDPERRLAKATEAAELETLLEVLLCEAQLETRIARLEAAMDLLQPVPSCDDLPEDLPLDPRALLLEVAGCLLDHLRPARDVMRRFEASLSLEGLGEPLPDEGVEESVVEVEEPGHRHCRDFLAGAEAGDLPALRHLLTCPLCRKRARVVLFGWATSTPRSSAPPAAAPRGTR